MNYYVCDFETSVYDGQTDTEVWAAACVKIHTEDVLVVNSIDKYWEWIEQLKGKNIVYFHNGAFDFSYILDYLLKRDDYAQATYTPDGKVEHTMFYETNDMQPNTFKYSISDMGQWYTMTVKTHRSLIEFRDSYKLIPLSVADMGKSFNTKHRKSTIEYKGERHAGYNITPDEEHYIKNDVLVVKEAIEFMFADGHKKLTIGACCMSEFKSGYNRFVYQDMFPNLYDIPLDPERYGATNADEYIRKAYRGGWCHVVQGKQCKVHKNGLTLDVNSLYPSMMHSDSGNYYPIGKPEFFSGAEGLKAVEAERQELLKSHTPLVGLYYYVRLRCRFRLKVGYLPFIQLKKNLHYRQNESLTTSDVWDENQKRYVSEWVDQCGKKHDTYVTMTMTMTDYELFKKHYIVIDPKILDGCYFEAQQGIYDKYLNKYREMKINAPNKGIRTVAKLYSNNLYGKQAASTISSYKVAMLKPNGVVGFFTVAENEKTPGYIACGAAITSYARNFTITAAQQNYYGVDNPGFIYADTDSLHLDLPLDKIKGVTLHPRNYCCWKNETNWDVGFFTRQKTYIEHVTHEDGEPIETPHYIVTCAGANKTVKQLFIHSVEQDYDTENNPENYTPEELEFIREPRSISDFVPGIMIPGKLSQKRIKGGVILADTTFEMH